MVKENRTVEVIVFISTVLKNQASIVNLLSNSFIKGKKTNNMETLNISFDKANFEQQKAFDIVANTNTCLFITGKAGTGKTTFIKWIQEKVNKNFLVLAPTGIAAIAVGGQTMHSFFGLPMKVVGPNEDIEISYEKKVLLEKVDTIIVDEVSMVRSDMVDSMDRCLRIAFSTNMPFGGKQIVFVGDLFQLPPVVKWGSADEEMLTDIYGTGTPFFYKANVLKRINLPKIEFRKVYRQNDSVFVDILNRMRVGKTTTEDLKLLNQHVSNTCETKDFSVILTAYNSMAEKINEKKLNEIEAEEYIFQGVTEGLFKRSDSPVPEILRLKVGAQVIFCRNDYNHGCANGTIAKVVDLSDGLIRVKLENGNEFNVNMATWESHERRYNRETKKVESEVVGTYTQYPLKLAWAITIHKSQGMTFERMHFDLTHGTFAPGQAYVAISRMRSLDGLTLSTPIMSHHITQNPEVLAFANSYNDVEMINDELETGKLVYKFLAKKEYDNAAKSCLRLAVMKAQKGDYRNAALIAKQMFDVMIDDDLLLGLTKNYSILKNCSITCHFLNAVFCLYGYRYEEAIGYANMVLSRKNCLEAMFIKNRALYLLGKYNEAYTLMIQTLPQKETEGKRVIDKKQYLLEAKINEKIGNTNIPICQKIIKLSPECIAAYTMLRKEVLKKGLTFERDEDEEEENNLIFIFNDVHTTNKDFEKMLTNNTNKKALINLRRKLVALK